LFGYLPLGGAGDANISARQTSHLSGPYFQFVMRSGIISAIKKHSMNQVKSASVVSTEEVWPALSVAPFWFQLNGNNSFQHSSSPVTQMCELRSSIIFSW
jgi:hypothetical protein